MKIKIEKYITSPVRVKIEKSFPATILVIIALSLYIEHITPFLPMSMREGQT